MTRPTLAVHVAGAAVLSAVLAVGLTYAAPSGRAAVSPGTPGNDVTIGKDNDNASNGFIQPPGVAAPQHLHNTDLVFGRDGNDLLVGRLGADVLLGGTGADILIGGPDKGQVPNSDVVVAEEDNDVALWSPADGSEMVDGGPGVDTVVFAPLVTRYSGGPVLETFHGRLIPRVAIDSQPRLDCQLVPVPASQQLGFSFLVRFVVKGTHSATIRLKDVEQVLCPSSTAGSVRVADLTSAHPTFTVTRLDRVQGLLGAIVAPK